MAFRTTGPARRPGTPIVLPRWSRYVIPVLAAVIALIVIVSVGAGVWTDWLWFRSVGYTSVFGTTYGVKWALFAIAAVFMMAVIGVNIRLAYRLRPPQLAVTPRPAPQQPAAAQHATAPQRPVSPQQQGLEAYRQVIEPRRRLVVGLILGLIGLISGLAAAGDWRTWLLFANRVPFGVKDPQFHLDISFFVFDYPFIRMVLSFLFAGVLLSILAAAIVHYLYGGLRLQLRGERATQGTRVHLFVLIGIFVLLKAIAYWVDRYGIDFSQRGVVQTGASYTDVNAVLPAKTVLAVIALICAALFFAGAIRRNAMLPAVGFGLLVLSAVIVGGLYPAIVQQFVVKPNELAKEGPYLAREIKNTRAAYGINKVQVTPYSAVSSETLSQLGTQAAALPDVRQLDPGVVSAAFQQLQQVKGYYKFAGVLSVDRYKVPGVRFPRTWSWASATCPGRQRPRPTGSTAISSTPTASGSSPLRRTRPRAVATLTSPRATSRRRASSMSGSPGCTSASRRRATRSSAATSSSWTTPTPAPAARRTRRIPAAAASRSARR